MTPSKVYLSITLLFIASFTVVQAQNKTIDSLKIILRTIPDDTNKVKCLIDLCAGYSDVDINKMMEAAQEALACAKRNDYEKGISQAFGCLGAAYAEAGNPRRAVEYFLEGLRIAERRNDRAEMALNYHDIGSSYVEQNRFDEGIQYFQKAVAIWRQLGNTKGPVTVLYNMGNAYQQQGKDSIALLYYHKAIAEAREIGSHYSVVISMINMSGLYLKQKDNKSAHRYIEEALQLAISNNFTNILSEIYGTYSDIYVAEGMPKKAQAMAEKGLLLAKQVNIKLYTLQNYKRLADIHHFLGNSAEAYTFLSSYAVLSDTIKNEINRTTFDKMVHGYELEKKDIQLAAQAQQYRSDIFRRNAFIGLLICLSLLGFMLYNRTKLILASKQQQLKHSTQSLLEKSTIISSITEELEALKGSTMIIDDNMEKFGKILRLKVHTEEDWQNFKKAFDEVYPRFFNGLRYKYPGITASELRLAAITKLNLSIKEAATMLGISSESVKQSRYRLKKRIEVPENVTLKNFLEENF